LLHVAVKSEIKWYVRIASMSIEMLYIYSIYSIGSQLGGVRLERG
jgi:hypothetical protein